MAKRRGNGRNARETTSGGRESSGKGQESRQKQGDELDPQRSCQELASRHRPESRRETRPRNNATPSKHVGRRRRRKESRSERRGHAENRGERGEHPKEAAPGKPHQTAGRRTRGKGAAEGGTPKKGERQGNRQEGPGRGRKKAPQTERGRDKAGLRAHERPRQEKPPACQQKRRCGGGESGANEKISRGDGIGEAHRGREPGHIRGRSRVNQTGDPRRGGAGRKRSKKKKARKNLGGRLDGSSGRRREPGAGANGDSGGKSSRQGGRRRKA